MPARAVRSKAGNRLCLQEQSPLFNKFSPEIRQMIYGHVLTGYFFYIIQKRSQKRSRLAHVRRLYSRFETPILLSPEALLRGAGTDFNARVPKILRTCRAVYAEAIHLLYGGNTFDTKQIGDFVTFMDTPAQQRFHSIRKITASWKVDTRDCGNGLLRFKSEKWEKAWSTLSQMENLRELAVKLHANGPIASAGSTMAKTEVKSPFMQAEREILRLPWTVKLSQKWKLYVNWPQCVLDDFEDAPFAIERTYTLS